jgi:hypothetical protein
MRIRTLLRNAPGVPTIMYNRNINHGDKVPLTEAVRFYDAASEIALGQVQRRSKNPMDEARVLLGNPPRDTRLSIKIWAIRAWSAGAKAEEAKQGRRFRGEFAAGFQ